MKNKVFLLFFLSVFIFSSFTKHSKTIDAELVSIKYYSVNSCNNNSVFVMVTYNVDYSDIYSLKMKNKYSNGIVTNSQVNETNKKGQIIYSFCSQKNKKTSFKTCFITKDGKESNFVDVFIDASSSEIITGTPPKTIIKSMKL